MNEGGKRDNYKQKAKQTYGYFKERTCLGWNWLIDRPERLTALSTFAIFLATAVAVGVGIAQWHALRSTDKATHIAAVAAKQSAEIANQTLHAAQRPWLSFEDVKIAGPLTFDEIGGHLPIKFTVKNSGTSPAVGSYIHANVLWSEQNPFFPGDLIRKGATGLGVGNGSGEGIFPGKHEPKEFSVTINSADFTGNAGPFLLILAKYKFPFAEKIGLTGSLFNIIRSDAAMRFDPQAGPVPPDDVLHLLPVSTYTE